MPIRLSGMVSGMDTESMVSELMKAQNLKKTKIQNKITTSEWKQEKWKDLNSKIYSFYTGTLSKMRLQNSFSTRLASSSNDAKVSITANSGAPKGTHSLRIDQLASAQFATGGTLTTDINNKTITGDTLLSDLGMTAGAGNKIKVTAGGIEKTLTITAETKVSDFVNTLKSAGLNANYDTNQKRFFISSKESGTENSFTLKTEGAVDLSKLGLHTIAEATDGVNTVVGGGAMTLLNPKDAKFNYNGVDMTSSSNNVTVNGLTLTLKGVSDKKGTVDTTDDEVISLNVQDNTKAVYDMVKEFVTKYNELLKDMNDTYHSVSAKGYDPLTDEQKESMTDDQIEKWESKIKDSLLRRDDTLGSLIDTMRNDINGRMSINGKQYSLSSFGIVSGNYTEKGKLHIKGDSEDSLYSGYGNKLMTALTEEPENVMQVITEMAGELYTSLTDKMKSSTLRSALTLYNDKDLTKTINNHKSDLKNMEKKLAEMESRYYKQFSAMESAMAKLNSQSSSLASMLGTNM